MNPALLLVTCEHASNAVPPAFARFFTCPPDILASHKGWDPGASELADLIAALPGCTPPLKGTLTRLLVELNRSPGGPAFFSRWSKSLPEHLQNELRRMHSNHWKIAEQMAARCIRRHGYVLHLSMHTFTPWWRGKRRTTDIGILCSTRRPRERAVADHFIRHLKSALPNQNIHRNRPYRGDTDGLATQLRTRFEEENYVGLEIECSQEAAANWKRLHEIASALKDAITALSIE